jgi:putative membrane protein
MSLLALGGAACNASVAVTTLTDASADASAPAIDAGPLDAGGESDAPSADGGRLSDDQIVGVIGAADTGELEEGQLALTRTTAPGVVSFARATVSDAADSNARLATLERRDELSPQSSAAQLQLEVESALTLASLQRKSGGAFDLAYVDSQISANREAVALAQVMLRDTSNPSLRTFLEGFEGLAQMHLQMAEMLAAELGGGTVDGGRAEAGIQ